MPLLPQVPTVAEGGVPGFDLDIWFGVAAPAKTPPEVLALLSKEIAEIVAQPDVDGAHRARPGCALPTPTAPNSASRSAPTTNASARSSATPASSRTEAFAMHVIIIGGGIAGLSQALSLHQIGIACRVYEAVPTLAPLGYGINLQPNAIRELTALGLGEQACRGRHAHAGARVLQQARPVDLDRAARPRRRLPLAADFHLARRAAQNPARRDPRAAWAATRSSRAIASRSFEQRGDTVIARFADPSGKPAGEAEGDILIGADGIHSAVRQHFYKGEKAVFDGYLHYRGIVEAEPYLTGASMAVVGHRTHRAIIYPVMQRPGGKVMINWLAYTKIPPGSPPLEAWDTAADKQACVDQFKGWTYPWLDVHGLFAATPAEHVLQLPNVDRDPIPRWSFGRVTLIGDAAHPMQPVGAQAGSQAVVDGRVLAASLMATRDPAEALTRYQNERIAAMNDMIVRNRNLGLNRSCKPPRSARRAASSTSMTCCRRRSWSTPRSASRRRRASTSRPSTAASRSSNGR